MNQVVRKPTVLVYETQQFQSLAEVFSGLGSSCDYVHTPQDFQSKLLSATYSGVCIVASFADIANLKSIFLELETKSLLEGLRSVLMIVRMPGQEQFFARSKIPWLVQFQFSFLRDIIEIDPILSPVDRESATRRIAFATQFDSRNPFGQKFPLLSRWKTNAEVSVPARLSWFNEMQGLLGIECGARIAKDTPVRVFLQVNGQPLCIAGVVKENLPGQLRFNFGNSLSLELIESSATALKRVIAGENNNQVIKRNLRRAFIVTRSVALRQTLVRTFSKNDVDCRIPLVKRNILADLPLLAPHFVVIEDRVLIELIDRDGEQVCKQIRHAAGPHARIALSCDSKSAPILKKLGFDIIAHSAGGEAAIETWILEQKHPNEEDVFDKKVWFAHASRVGRATATIEEKTYQLSNDGLVLRGQNQYRMWANMEVSIPGTGIQFVGKTVANALVCDSFRNQSNAAAADNANLIYISTLTRSAELGEEVLRHLRTQLSGLPSMPDHVIPTMPTAAQISLQTAPVRFEAQSPDASVTTSLNETYRDLMELIAKGLQSILLKIKAAILVINFKKLGILLATFIIAGLVLKFLSQYKGNEGKIYSDSFRQLFENRGK